MPVLDPILTLVANFSMASLFLLACYGKLTGFTVFRATLADYELMPASLTGVVASAVIALEMAIGFGALVPFTARAAMVAAAALLLIYAAAIGINLARGRRDIDCGCTGPATRQPLSGWLLARNAGLAGVALIGAAAQGERVMQAADFVLAGLALVAAASLYGAINQLMANAPRLDSLDSTMDAAG